MLSLWCMNAQAQSIRKNYREMTAKEREVYCTALEALRLSGRMQVYATLHSTHSNLSNPTLVPPVINTYIHNSEDFTPWHRWFIYNFEKDLRNSGAPGAVKINMPYWDWTSVNYTSVPTDRTPAAPIFNDSYYTPEYGFLGKYNSLWSLGRIATSSSYPTNVAVNDVLSNNIYSNHTAMRPRLEGVLHNGVHNIVGGVMVTALSPNDPIFYLHHAMIDKIWQDWLNVGNKLNTFSNNTMPSVPVGSFLPNIGVDAIKDSRDIKVFYADNGFVNIDKYTVSNQIDGTNIDNTNTENFRYTGIINLGGSATNFFTVPSGKICNVLSSQAIVLKPGTTILAGSVFSAKIDATSFTTARVAINDVVPDVQTPNNDNKFAQLLIFPNPSKDKVAIFTDPNGEEMLDITIVDISGKAVLYQIINGLNTELNIQDLSAGSYTIHIQYRSGNGVNKLLIKL